MLPVSDVFFSTLRRVLIQCFLFYYNLYSSHSIRTRVVWDLIPLHKRCSLLDFNGVGLCPCWTTQAISRIYCKMLEVGIESNAFTLSGVTKACSDLGDLRLGMCFHVVVLERGFNKNHVISSALIDMYGENAGSDDSRRVFDEMPEPDFVCLTTVILEFTRNDRYGEDLEFYYSMQSKYNLVADEFTFGTVLTACGNLGRVKQ
ncbi:hypothetical protein MKX01_011985, partial [Papaver californicum]